MGAIWRQLLGIVLGGACIFWANSTLAQSKIIPDNTLGTEKSNVIPNYGGLPVEVISNGAIRGQNLFHSFLEFNVSAGRDAYFFSPSAAIQNIVTRVTGNNRSEILGVLGTFGSSNPNLFLINPNGIIFGQHASLDVGGSFVATTANAIQFGNQGVFSASEPNNPALLTVNPSALFYNKIAAGAAIQNSSIAPAETVPTGLSSSGLRVPDGKSLLLVGGNISMDGGGLNAYGGRIEFGGLAAPETVGIEVDGNNLSLSFPDKVTRSDVSLTFFSEINVVGSGAGSITVNAKNINITAGGLEAGIAYGFGSVSEKAGDITLNATGDIKIDSLSNITNNVLPQTIVNGGNITLSSNFLALTNSALIQSITSGKGNGGNIQITTDQLSITNGAELNAATFRQGNSGNIIINATKSVSVDRGAINTLNRDYNVSYSDGIFSTLFNTKGQGGNIQISTGQLSLTNDGLIVSGTLGQGKSGDINIQAKSVSLTNGTLIASTTEGKGNGGNIQISTDQLSLTNNGQIASGTLGQGKSGDINIQAKSVSLTNRSLIFSTTAGKENGGNIQISTDQLLFVNSSGILAATLGEGNSGDVNIRAKSASLINGSGIDADSRGQGNAGNITLNASSVINLSGVDSIGGGSSGIFVNTDAPNSGSGGNAHVTTGLLQISDGAVIAARTRSTSNGGNIIVDANDLQLTNGGELLTTAYSSGRAGDIIVNAAKGITISGSDPTFDARLARIGRPTVDPVSSASGIFVNTQGTGAAGNLRIVAGSVRLDNGGILSADTKAGQGNIDLHSRNLILSRASNITTNATGTNVMGGNIKIDTDVLAAVENSKISADSIDFRGGQVAINAQSIFLSSDSSITARGVNQQLNGTVQINTPDIDPSSGLVTLPTVTEQTPKLVSSSCAAFNEIAGGSSFTITGHGGLPPSPDEPLTSDVVWTDTRLPNTTTQHQHKTHAAKPKPQPVAIVPATGWVFNDKGEVTLISSATNAASLKTPFSCPAR